MPAKNLPEYYLLNELIQKIKDQEYYRVFAKTLLMTVAPDDSVPEEEQLVTAMFEHFIQDGQLEYYRDSDGNYTLCTTRAVK